MQGLSALSLDALTSVAYGPEAILVVLAFAGSAALGLVLPITIGIVALLVILVISYRQLIDAYPEGGGAYAVSRANLGARVSLLAAAALTVDYTLTVAVSIAAGVGALTSAFPALSGATLPICLAILVVITALNLRGLADSARAFLLPTLVFIVGLLAIIATGLVHPLGSTATHLDRSLVLAHPTETIGGVLVLKAFAAGLTSLTGVEAIANGVPLFRPPRVQRAKQTELLLGVILAAMLLGLAVLASRYHVGPTANETVLSQIMTLSVGRSWAYYIVSLTVTIVLALAANTSFGGLPILASLLARDHYLPHLFGLRDDRQVFSYGILTLAVLAAALLIAVNGNTNRLIPLFAVGVFTAFTLSQSGLVVHWWRTRPRGWERRATINAVGATATAVATMVLLITKFTEGAWVVAIAIPSFIFLFTRIHRYYDRVSRVLALDQVPSPPRKRHTKVVVPVINISRLTEHAISEAISISDEVYAVHIALESGDQPSADSDEEIMALWKRWNPGVPLRVLHTEYASIADPIVAFIDELHRRSPCQIVLLIPVAIPDRARYTLLHNHLDLVLGHALRYRDDVIVARVPFRIPTDEDGPAAGHGDATR
ncbi:MAG: APC family permease [Candidatus Dormibacteraeota bacterium]|nr:APC family permease [Candidatus Dormibacteraeota bacterium]